jgi:NADPH:quinone reductase-like Zn-dependent oxidoreductase
VMAQVEYGAYREQVLAAAAHTTVLPDNISFEEGAAFGLAYLTCTSPSSGVRSYSRGRRYS